MYQIVLSIHVLIAVALIALVLLQQGKGASMGAAFGAGASQTVFGSQGSASFLMKITALLAVLFFITSLGLGYLAASAYRQAQTVAVPTPSQPITDESPAALPETGAEAETTSETEQDNP
jgi:preprotein translocase subunit SecG